MGPGGRSWARPHSPPRRQRGPGGFAHFCFLYAFVHPPFSCFLPRFYLRSNVLQGGPAVWRPGDWIFSGDSSAGE